VEKNATPQLVPHGVTSRCQAKAISPISAGRQHPAALSAGCFLQVFAREPAVLSAFLPWGVVTRLPSTLTGFPDDDGVGCSSGSTRRS